MVKEKFYEVYMEQLTKNSLADILAKPPKELIGKQVKVDLSSLARGKQGEIKGDIIDIKENKALAEVTGLKLYPNYVKRFVRRGATKVDDSIVVEISEKKRIRIKLTFITRKKVNRSVGSALRKEAKDFLTKLLANQKVIEIIKESLEGDLQKKLSKKLKKIYPLSFCEIIELRTIKENIR